MILEFLHTSVIAPVCQMINREHITCTPGHKLRTEVAGVSAVEIRAAAQLDWLTFVYIIIINWDFF